MNTFCERLKEALELRHTNASQLSIKTGISRGAISHYINGDYLANQQNLTKIALALDVAEAWLMGHDVDYKREDIIGNSSAMEQVKIALFGDVEEVSDDEWNDVLNYVEYIKSKRKN